LKIEDLLIFTVKENIESVGNEFWQNGIIFKAITLLLTDVNRALIMENET
jgi:hypothetical protein